MWASLRRSICVATVESIPSAKSRHAARPPGLHSRGTQHTRSAAGTPPPQKRTRARSVPASSPPSSTAVRGLEPPMPPGASVGAGTWSRKVRCSRSAATGAPGPPSPCAVKRGGGVVYASLGPRRTAREAADDSVPPLQPAAVPVMPRTPRGRSPCWSAEARRTRCRRTSAAAEEKPCMGTILPCARARRGRARRGSPRADVVPEGEACTSRHRDTPLAVQQ